MGSAGIAVCSRQAMLDKPVHYGVIHTMDSHTILGVLQTASNRNGFLLVEGSEGHQSW